MAVVVVLALVLADMHARVAMTVLTHLVSTSVQHCVAMTVVAVMLLTWVQSRLAAIDIMCPTRLGASHLVAVAHTRGRTGIGVRGGVGGANSTGRMCVATRRSGGASRMGRVASRDIVLTGTDRVHALSDLIARAVTGTAGNGLAFSVGSSARGCQSFRACRRAGRRIRSVG
jgi:hypothetical protein